MNERTGLYTRRSILGLAAGLLATGCATTRSNGSGGGSSKVFPHAQAWCFDAGTAASLDLLGKLIMKDRNPYCTNPADPTAAAACVDTNTGTWPHALSNETTWKYLTQFDFYPNPMNFPVQTWQFKPGMDIQVTRSMRIPYLIKHSKAKKKKVAVNLGAENLLVGFQPRSEAPVSPVDWAADTSCAQKDPVAELADFITENMVNDGDTKSMAVANWNIDETQPGGQVQAGAQKSIWYFRRAPILVDYSFRFPVASRGMTAAPKGGWIYIGYEGGGAY